MNSEKNVEIKKLSTDFLLCCYFGESKNLLDAAVNRAYIDMAAHTLRGFKDNDLKWKCRWEATIAIKRSIIEYPCDKGDFNEWHEYVISQIERKYDPKVLSYGQAQKWLNMTIKYLFVLGKVIGYKDARLDNFVNFLSKTSPDDYFVPVDSYVLKGAGIDKECSSWSTANQDDYERIKSHLVRDKDFLWELKCWESLSKTYKVVEKDSYEYYCRKRQKEKNYT